MGQLPQIMSRNIKNFHGNTLLVQIVYKNAVAFAMSRVYLYVSGLNFTDWGDFCPHAFLQVWLPFLFQKIELQIATENYKFFIYESLLSSTEGIKSFREVMQHVTLEGGLILETP